MPYSEKDRQLAGLTLQLLANAQLTGREVGNFVNVNNWLQSIMMQNTAIVEPHDNMLDEESDKGTKREHQN